MVQQFHALKKELLMEFGNDIEVVSNCLSCNRFTDL